jgi:predicted nucleotidyltransferase
LEAIKDMLEDIKKNLTKRFRENIRCLILYGSWAKGLAREDSDIDLLVVFEAMDKETGKVIHEIESHIDGERNITIVPTNLEDFRKERLPLFTAVKREGKVIYGDVDLSINPGSPKIKYSEFFKRSFEFESQKVKIAEELLEKDLASGVADLCFVASKHAIQAALAMKGVGYSSKMMILLPLTEKYFGKEMAEVFKKLFHLYIKSEYGMEFLTDEEARLAVKYVQEVLTVYSGSI